MLHRVNLFGNIECLFKLSLLQWLANSCLYLTTAGAEPHTCGNGCFSFLELHKENRSKARLRLGIQWDASNRKYGTLHRFLHPCIHINRPNVTDHWREFWMRLERINKWSNPMTARQWWWWRQHYSTRSYLRQPARVCFWGRLLLLSGRWLHGSWDIHSAVQKF